MQSFVDIKPLRAAIFLFGIILLIYGSYWSFQGSKRPEVQPPFYINVKEGEPFQAQRLLTLQTVCKSPQLQDYKLNATQIVSMFYYSKHRNISVCKVPKSGSTFWTRIYFYLENVFSPNTLLKLSRVDVHRKSKKHIVHFKTISNLNTQNIIISRNPYSRLYSAYVDKLYLLGFVAEAKRISKGSLYVQDGLVCGYNVSFQEFLDHVTKVSLLGGDINNHWAPVYLQCRACEIDYHYVVKQESLANDTEYVLDQMSFSDSDRQHLRTLTRARAINITLAGNIATLLQQRRNERKICPSVTLFIKKLWISLQIQGYIRDNIKFPDAYFSNEQNSGSDSVILKMILETIARYPLSSHERNMQRRKHLVSAYSDINQRTLKKIQAMYKLDFILFNYDAKPPLTL